jgi:hypothetical protein
MNIRGISGPLGNRRFGEQLIEDKQAEFQAAAEEARELHEAGYKSPVRRLIERLLPSLRRGDDLPVRAPAEDDWRPGQIRRL